MSSQLQPVVVGVDGSSRSDRAVRWAAKVAAARRWPIRLVHGVWATEADFGPMSPGIESLYSKALQSGERMLEDARRLVAEVSTDIDVTVFMPNTSPAVALIHQARDARLVVVGATGGHAFVDMLLGSTAYAVTRHVHTPVAVIRGYAENIEPSTTLPVVVGVDGSEASEQAVGLAFEEAATRGAPLIAVHAWTDLSYDQMYRLTGYAVAWPHIEELEERVLAESLTGWAQKYPEVTVTREVVQDRPRDVLLNHSAKAQLMVVGSHGRGGFERMLLGSTSQAVLEYSDCPVLVVRP